MENTIDIEEMFLIIGEKEFMITRLNKRVKELQREIEELKKPLEVEKDAKACNSKV